MANKDHLEFLKKGVEVWNAWRREEPFTYPDLSGADLSGADLKGTDLCFANLKGAVLNRANIQDANLHRADLYSANLCGANCIAADLHDATLNVASLSGADLRHAGFRGARLRGADLSQANLRMANLSNAYLDDARFIQANCFGAHLNGAVLNNANLSDADLTGVELSSAMLGEASFNRAILAYTTFGNNDLSTAKGLETVIHRGPSTIGIDTLFRSDGKIPEVFLRGAGVPEDFITFVPSLVGRAIEFYSCFISYSHQDEEFSRRLHSQMRSENLRVWFAPEDMKAGRKLHEEIFRAIQIHDKLLLVLSENSMRSQWVITEVKRAKKVERDETRRKLFPIRLVDFETIQNWECFDADSGKDLAAEVREYYIPDFSNWKDHDSFEREFAKLLGALRATEK